MQTGWNSELNSLFHRAYRLVRHGNRKARLLRLINKYGIRLQRDTLWTYPPFLSLDPFPACNLQCVCCPTGEGISKLSRTPLSPETFRAIVSNLRVDRLAHVSLYHLGEPLLNRNLPDYISYFAGRNITTVISVNFSAEDYDDEYMQRLVKSGLDTITVSVDGTTQETYEKYRQGGNLERVLANMRRLADVKLALGSRRPRVVYKMLLNRFNEHQVEEARQLAHTLDAEFYQPHFFHIQDNASNDWQSSEFKERYGERPQVCIETDDASHRQIDTECRQLWDTLTVTATGDVFPCCFTWDPAYAVGNLTRQHIRDIWNNEKMRALRRYVTDRNAPPPPFPNPCAGCTHRYCTFWQNSGRENRPEPPA